MTVYYSGGYTGETYDLTHPRICYSSMSRRGTVAVTTEETGYEGINAASPFTYSHWRPTSVTANYTITLSSGTEMVNYVAVAAHNVGTVGGGIQVRTKLGGASWTDRGPAVTPTTDDPIVILFNETEVDMVRVQFTTAIPTVGVIYAGSAIEIPQPVYMGSATPADLATQTEFTTNRATKGNFLGRSIKRQTNQSPFTIKNLTESYIRTTLAPFIDDAVTYPYFLVERPGDYPDAVSYRWSDADITPARNGITSHMDLTL